MLIIVLYVALCLVSDSIHLCGHHFVTFLVTEVRKINGNQITLLTERLEDHRVQFTVHRLSFKTFPRFYYLSLSLFIAPSPQRLLTLSVALHLSSAELTISAPLQTEMRTPGGTPFKSPQSVLHCLARKVLWTRPAVPWLQDQVCDLHCHRILYLLSCLLFAVGP